VGFNQGWDINKGGYKRGMTVLILNIHRFAQHFGVRKFGKQKYGGHIFRISLIGNNFFKKIVR